MSEAITRAVGEELAVPRDFQEEIAVAFAAGQAGDLRFLASELEGLRWKREGRRIVAEAQFQLEDYLYSAETWETIREELPEDVQANLRLGAIYQKVGDLTGSDPAAPRSGAPESPLRDERTPPRVLLFTGHRVDAPDRARPRFPADQEPVARAAIRRAIAGVLADSPGEIVAISGAASGGDLIFLEVCEERGIPRRIFLVIPRDDYVGESVAPSGEGWVRRFQRQTDGASQAAATRYYQGRPALPAWLQDKPGYSVWERSNLWMLHNALWIGGTNTTLIALWDGKSGDGPGGTRHMVESAAGRGAQTIILDTDELFQLHD